MGGDWNIVNDQTDRVQFIKSADGGFRPGTLDECVINRFKENIIDRYNLSEIHQDFPTYLVH